MPSNFEKKLFKVAIVNTDEMVKSESRDAGDAKMTESKEDRSGSRLGRMAKRIWKHNLAQEWYRQREIRKVKEEILKTGNIYAGEQDFDPDKKASSGVASKEAMEAIIERFTSEYEDEEVLREGESRHSIEGAEINAKIKDLIKKYAGSNMPVAAFQEDKKRILSRYDKQMASEKSLYTDNLLSIANEVKEAVIHGADLAQLDFDVEIILGTAKQSLSTEAHQTSFDKGVEKLQNSKIGKYLTNEPAALAIAAGLYEVGRNSLQKIVRSKAAQWATFGLAAVASGGISAMKERARVTRERAQHQRESAKGMKFKEKDMKRRQEMEKNSYDTKEAVIIIENLKNDLNKVKEGNLSEQEVSEVMGRLADLEARIKLNDEKKIDLITYDKFNNVEKDRTTMDLKRAELKVALRNSDDVEDFDTQFSHIVDVQKEQLLKSEGGIEKQDEVFRKLRNTRAWKAFGKTVLIGSTIGFAFQEGRALLDSEEDGIIEGGIKHFTGKEDMVKQGTSLEALRRYLTGDSAPVPKTNLHEELFDNSSTHIQLPEGYTFGEQNSDGTFDLLKDGDVVSGHVPVGFDAQGNLSQEAQDALAKNGITTNFGLIGEKTTEAIHENTEDYVRDHASSNGMVKIHRELWYDNNTPHPFDQNELRADWGGVNNTGIDSNGNYVFNVSRMTAAGSFHGSQSIDAAGQVHSGGLKMLFSFSRGTQHEVFQVPIDEHGNAIIDPNTPLGKMMFENHDGQAVFTGKFAEVAEARGLAPDGGENVRILATHVGHGKDMIDDVINKDTTVPKVLLNIHEDDYNVPLFVPLTGRRPLEKGEYEKDRTVQASRPKTREEQLAANRGENNNERDNTNLARVKIPAGSFNAGIADKIRYSAKKGFSGEDAIEESISKKTNHIYAFMGLDREAIYQKLRGSRKYSNPEVLILENDVSKRASNIKQIAYLKKWHPGVKFTYVALPKNVKKLEGIDIKTYSKKRLERILKHSKLNKNVKHELHGSPEVERKPIGLISPAEFELFLETGKVSTPRLQSIAEKIKSGETLSDQEQSMRAEQHVAVEKLLKRM